MKLPHKVRITPKQSYEICFVDRFENPDNVGECRLQSKQIMLLKSMPEREMFRTFIHELLHAIECEYEFELPHQGIYELEVALERILKLNKWLPKK